MAISLRILAVVALVAGAGVSGQSSSAPLTGGGQVTINRSGDFVNVSVRGPRAGLASLCLADDSRVRILHASAAVGEASYERDGERWVLKGGFDWKLRDSPKTGPPAREAVDAFLSSTGWTANPSHSGSPQRDFRIRLTGRAQFLAVTFLATSEPMAISYWPATLEDDCRAIKIAQGYLPETARFDSSRWHSLQ